MVDMPGWLTLTLIIGVCALLPIMIAFVRWWDARRGGDH